MHKTKRMLSGVMALIMCASLMGCAAAVVGGAAATAAYVYKDGWLEYTYDAGLERSYSASKLALQDMGITITGEDKELADAEIKGVYNGQDVWVDLVETTPTSTVIGVRVTVMGDRNASSRIHDAIARRL